MNRDNLILIFRFLLLLFLQAFLLNNINFFGFINPNLYLLFIIVYRLDGNPTLLIVLGFVMGLLLDLLTQGTGGANHCRFDHIFHRSIYGHSWNFPPYRGLVVPTTQASTVRRHVVQINCRTHQFDIRQGKLRPLPKQIPVHVYHRAAIVIESSAVASLLVCVQIHATALCSAVNSLPFIAILSTSAPLSKSSFATFA